MSPEMVFCVVYILRSFASERTSQSQLSWELTWLGTPSIGTFTNVCVCLTLGKPDPIGRPGPIV